MVLFHYQLPSNWQRPTTPDEICFTVPMASAEYNLTIDQFKATMKSYSPTIVRLERIQNERWYKQYKVHEDDFHKRLNKDTVGTLYHGCPEVSAKAIIKDGFNRSFAGVNGTAYGNGVYFATDANYSHSYAHVNSAGERCMFIVKVLIGTSIQGNSSMKVCPVGYDSTTNGSNIFVAYHDAQSYAEYLITYK
ncbi:unnamed protein product [Rotaria sp. Silwood2]|nr:unnamed protein product [Rotaria sp. Silwood2]